MTALPPKADISGAWGGRNDSPHNGTFGQTGTLGDLIDGPLPALLSVLHGLQRGIPSLGYLRGDLLLDVMLAHRKLYGPTRTRQCSLRGTVA
jgi:hypothetical protein